MTLQVENVWFLTNLTCQKGAPGWTGASTSQMCFFVKNTRNSKKCTFQAAPGHTILRKIGPAPCLWVFGVGSLLGQSSQDTPETSKVLQGYWNSMKMYPGDRQMVLNLPKLTTTYWKLTKNVHAALHNVILEDYASMLSVRRDEANPITWCTSSWGPSFKVSTYMYIYIYVPVSPLPGVDTLGYCISVFLIWCLNGFIAHSSFI